MDFGIEKAVFLDRDGVLNFDPGHYTYRLSEFKILPEVTETLRIFQSRGYKLIVITNQAGIAKGLYTTDTVEEIHDFMSQHFEEAGVKLTDVFYSPNHEDYSKSLDRKPGSLMIEKAMAIYNIDPQKSYMIGDKERDVEAAERVGVRGIKVETNQSISFITEIIE